MGKVDVSELVEKYEDFIEDVTIHFPVYKLNRHKKTIRQARQILQQHKPQDYEQNLADCTEAIDLLIEERDALIDELEHKPPGEVDEDLIKWLGADETSMNMKAFNAFYNHEFNERCIAKIEKIIQSRPERNQPRVGREEILQLQSMLSMEGVSPFQHETIISNWLKKIGIEVSDK